MKVFTLRLCCFFDLKCQSALYRSPDCTQTVWFISAGSVLWTETLVLFFPPFWLHKQSTTRPRLFSEQSLNWPGEGWCHGLEKVSIVSQKSTYERHTCTSCAFRAQTQTQVPFLTVCPGKPVGCGWTSEVTRLFNQIQVIQYTVAGNKLPPGPRCYTHEYAKLQSVHACRIKQHRTTWNYKAAQDYSTGVHVCKRDETRCSANTRNQRDKGQRHWSAAVLRIICCLNKSQEYTSTNRRSCEKTRRAD